jgi:hypothetical protein
MNSQDLGELYEATGEDLLFAIGALLVSGQEPAPYIHVFYRDWSREQLEVVRESFRKGLILVRGKRPKGGYDLYIGTRETISLQAKDGGHTSVLRAPAWDAHLAEVNEEAAQVFEANRRRTGGFLLLLQTPEWEFLTAVDDARGGTTVGPIEKRSLPMPDGIQRQ